MSPAKDLHTSALIAGLAAFTSWGLIPIYWKLLKAIPAAEILAHRFVWTNVFLIALLTWQGRWSEVRQNVSSRRTALYCFYQRPDDCDKLAALYLGGKHDRVIETSLGYFMTPLVNVLLGAIFLRERLTRLQLASVALATIGVLNLTFGYGRFPWVALSLCATFGSYGFLRKQSGTGSIPGLFLETTLLVPFALLYLGFPKTRNNCLDLPGRPGSRSYLSALA